MDKASTARRKRTQRDYTMGFKLAVVEQIEKGQMTYKQAQRHYRIQGRSTVLVAHSIMGVSAHHLTSAAHYTSRRPWEAERVGLAGSSTSEVRSAASKLSA